MLLRPELTFENSASQFKPLLTHVFLRTLFVSFQRVLFSAFVWLHQLD